LEQFLNLKSTFKTQQNYSLLFFEELNANRILLYLYTFKNILHCDECPIHKLFQTRKQNNIFSNINIGIDLKKLEQIDSKFLKTLNEKLFKIDGDTKITSSCLTENHSIIQNKHKYGIYLLRKSHPRFDIFLKLPCMQDEEYDEVHIFIQAKTSQAQYYESTSNIKTSCKDFVEALDCHQNKYRSLTNNRILTCMVIIDSRYVNDCEDIRDFTNQDKLPCKIITFNELQLLFPNFSHRFVIRNSKDYIDIQTK